MAHHVARRPILDHLAHIHHRHLVRDLGDDAHIMGDEQDRHAKLVLKRPDQRQDLRLGGDVQRGGRLVGDQQRRVGCQRNGDHGALAHAARQLMRVLVDAQARVGKPDLAQHVDRQRACRLLVKAAMQPDGLDHLIADGVDRRERGHRLLKDHGDLAAADGADLLAARREAGEIDHRPLLGSKQQVRAVEDLRRVRQQLHQGLGRQALAGAGLADQAQGPSMPQSQVDPVHRHDPAFIGADGDFQVADRQQKIVGQGRRGVHPMHCGCHQPLPLLTE